jgi:DNA-binding response OmpR family regulator
MRILCVDDASDILEELSISLRMRWSDVDVVEAEDGPTALALFESESPDLFIIDLGLPGMDGYEVIGHIRARSDVPIIILSMRDSERDVVKGLDLGADGCISKPIRHLELLARIQAVLRRARYSVGIMEQVINVGRLRLDPNTREVHMGDKAVTLTPTEYNVLYHLALNAGRVQTHRALMSKIWGRGIDDDRYLLYAHIRNLRSKLKNTGDEPSLISAQRGIGYRLVK